MILYVRALRLAEIKKIYWSHAYLFFLSYPLLYKYKGNYQGKKDILSVKFRQMD